MATQPLRQILGFPELPHAVPGEAALDSYGPGESESDGTEPTPRICVLFMEKCDYSLQDFDLVRYTEPEAAFVCRSVLAALSHLHALRIVHRDIKPGNILVGNGGERILLGDFGLATFLKPDGEILPSNGGGTHGFLAPECLEENVVCKESDLFALGAVLYQLLFRVYAFIKENPIETDIATLLGELPLIPCGRAVGKSDQACHLIRLLLERSASDRPTAADALEHQWFGEVDAQETLKTFLAEQHRRDLVDLDSCPVVHQNAMRQSEQDAFKVESAQAESARSFLHRATGVWRGAPLTRFRLSLERILSRSDRKPSKKSKPERKSEKKSEKFRMKAVREFESIVVLAP